MVNAMRPGQMVDPGVGARALHRPNSSANQLWEVPLEGSTPTMITAENSGQGDDPGFGGDLGDVDAWKLPGGTFLQSSGACGTAFLSKLTPTDTTRVKIPGCPTMSSSPGRLMTACWSAARSAAARPTRW